MLSSYRTIAHHPRQLIMTVMRMILLWHKHITEECSYLHIITHHNQFSIQGSKFVSWRKLNTIFKQENEWKRQESIVSWFMFAFSKEKLYVYMKKAPKIIIQFRVRHVRRRDKHKSSWCDYFVWYFSWVP